MEKPYLNLEDSEVVDSLSSGVQPLAEALFAIFDDADMDMESLKSRIAAVETQANNTLTGTDLEGILNACSVASNTLDYWFLSAEDWAALGGYTTRCGFSWKTLGKADVKGAVVTGLGGGLGRILRITPIGWKAWAAATLVGAVMCSADYAYEELVNNRLILTTP